MGTIIERDAEDIERDATAILDELSQEMAAEQQRRRRDVVAAARSRRWRPKFFTWRRTRELINRLFRNDGRLDDQAAVAQSEADLDLVGCRGGCLLCDPEGALMEIDP